jgi:hypothetical protein
MRRLRFQHIAGSLVGTFVLATTLGAAAPVGAAPASAREPVSVIVRELPGAGDRPERLVGRLGGEVGRRGSTQ